MVRPGPEPVTQQQIRMTTASGSVWQLMGSDNSISLAEFPVVIAYNGIHHFCPTAYLSDSSLTDWRMACFTKHIEAGLQFFHECNIDIPEVHQDIEKVETLQMG